MHLENELEKIDKKEKKQEEKKSSKEKKEKTITQEDINNDNQLKVGIDTLKAWSVIKQ